MKKPFPFKIGGDPEFNLFEDGNNVSAKTVMQRIFKRKEKEELGYRMDTGGSIGWDSWIRTAELRPLPAYTPKGLTKNIRTLLNTIQDKLPRIEMSTNSDPDPVGGHIHFEIDAETANNPERLENIHR